MGHDLPESNDQYGTLEYWNERYTATDTVNETFDWCRTYSDLEPFFNSLIPHKRCNILMLGAGDSRLTEDMWNAGYRRIWNVDFSPVVVDKMARRCSEVVNIQHVEQRLLTSSTSTSTSSSNGAKEIYDMAHYGKSDSDQDDVMAWHEMDIRDLKYPDEYFDVVIDKATMDALMCEKGDVWDPSPELCASVAGEVDEAYRVLKPGGHFIYATFGQPHFRKRHLVRDGWDLTVKTTGESWQYFVYIMHKHLAQTN
ncbi:S-adenosyl-L-methionine-dependent methyltransferase [Ramicandelaber brevisporus]|nr:S-adenosyl-L-methionine-dependent methyltransferase [Ramicandelaber brevisporus]